MAVALFGGTLVTTRGVFHRSPAFCCSKAPVEGWFLSLGEVDGSLAGHDPDVGRGWDCMFLNLERERETDLKALDGLGLHQVLVGA